MSAPTRGGPGDPAARARPRRTLQDVQADAALVVLAGALCLGLWQSGVLPGGWLGADLLLGLLGFAAVQRNCIPAVTRRARTDRTEGRDEEEAEDARSGDARAEALVGSGVAALLLVAVAARVRPMGSHDRGDLLALVLGVGNVRAGVTGAARAWDLTSAMGSAWVANLLLQALAVAALLLWAQRRLATGRLVGIVAAGILAASGAVAMATAGPVSTYLGGPLGRLASVGVGFAVGQHVGRLRRDVRVERWRTPLLAVVLLGVVVATAELAPAAVVLPVVVAAAPGIFLLREGPSASTVVRAAGGPAAVGLGSLVAIVAAAPLAHAAVGSDPAKALLAPAVVTATVISILVGRGLVRAAPLAPAATARAVGPPALVLAACAALVSSGFFHAVPVERLDRGPTAGPSNHNSPIAGIPESPRFCSLAEDADVARRLGEIELAVLDAGRARELRRERGPLEPGPWLRAAPAQLRPDLEAVLDGFDLLVTRPESRSEPEAQAALRSLAPVTAYLERICELPVRT